MKKTLFWEILIAIIIILSIIFGVILFVIPLSLRNFFTKEAYQAISISQNQVLMTFEGDNPDYDLFGDPNLDNIRNVSHMLLINGKLYASKFPPVELAEEMINKGLNQKNTEEKYQTKIEDTDIFYIIKKTSQGLIVSYLSGSYRDDLAFSLYKSLIFLMIAIILFSLIPSYLFSKKITKPLKELSENVLSLAKGEWEEEITIEREDEIGMLSRSVEDLRLELIRKDKAQSEFLQNISHDLKTPVMVIESYTEAIKDEVYPKGDLNSSLDTITIESKKLKGKIENLLMANRLKYFYDKETPKEEIDIPMMIEKSIEKLSSLRPEIEIIFKKEDWTIYQNRNSWESLVDNLLDNQLRYALSKIWIETHKDYVKFQNDGSPISEEYLKEPFKKFNIGEGGHYGLGLNIAMTVAKESGMTLKALNEEGMATFIIEKRE